jgi:hypothetical protein
MDDKAELENVGICPLSGTKGKKVDSATLKTMLAVSLTAVQDVPYFFCRDADCDVVYFSADGQQIFKTNVVRERVFQKEAQSKDVLICYCFFHTPGSIQAEFARTGTTSVIEAINQGIQAGQCACDWRNPQGDCCLGNVRRFVKQLTAE